MDLKTTQLITYIINIVQRTTVDIYIYYWHSFFSRHQCTRDPGPWKTQSIPSDKLSLYTNPGDCQCQDGGQICPEGSGGLFQPYWTLATENRVYNITATQFSTGDYVLRTWDTYVYSRW